MMRRPWLPAVLGLLLLSAGVALFLALFERVSVTVPWPPQGAARYNPSACSTPTSSCTACPPSSR